MLLQFFFGKGETTLAPVAARKVNVKLLATLASPAKTQTTLVSPAQTLTTLAPPQ